LYRIDRLSIWHKDPSVDDESAEDAKGEEHAGTLTVSANVNRPELEKVAHPHLR
jgi:hypothetical protein